MTDVRVMQPQEMGADFEFDNATQLWKLSKPRVSTTEDNAIIEDPSTGGAFLPNSDVRQFRLIQDNETRQLRLYSFPRGQSFDVSTASLVDTVDMVGIDAKIDDVAISGNVLTFYDKQTEQTIVFDMDSPIYQVLLNNSYTAHLSGDGKTTPLTVDVQIDPDTNNMLRITAGGLLLDRNDVLAMLNSGDGSDLNVAFTFVHKPDESLLSLTVAGVKQDLPTNRLVNTAGTVIGYIIAP